MHIKSPLINVTSPAAEKKKGKREMGCAARGGEARRHPCKRDRR